MDETKAEAEAWARTKPKRVIHNQTLIQIFVILAIATPIPAGGLVMYLTFCVAPAIVIPSLLALWFAAVVFEICVWVLKRNKS